MPDQVPIRLNVSDRTDFFLPICALYLLVIVAALISPYPILLGLLAFLSFLAGWGKHILKLPKANNVKLTSVIFPDGRVQLESGQERVLAGFLNGQQWCTRHFAILQISDGNSIKKLFILSAQQRQNRDFRRLNMWLRLDMCDNMSTRRLVRNEPVNRV
jgi:hypothetical protein